MTRLIRLFTLCVALGAMLAVPAQAQLAAPFAAERRAADMLADQLALLMRDALAGQGMPSEDQLHRADTLLDLALELSPADAELWRTKMELAELRGRSEDRRRALGEYLRLAPKDDRAQLQLILDRIGRAQTLDERLGMLERFLDNEAGRSLSAPLRSRLASRAASAAKELGDHDKYVQRLKQAIGLDSANGEAARMLFLLAEQESQSPLHHGAAAIAWVRGEPANPAGRLALARVLLHQGVYSEATRQFSMAAGLVPDQLDPEVLRLWVTSIAMDGQADQALELLRQVEGPRPDPSAQSALPVELQLIRLAIFSAEQRQDEAAAAWKRFADRLAPAVEANDEVAQRELAVASAVFGQDLDHAVDRVPAEAPEAIGQLVRGWVAVHRGDAAAARAALQPIAESDPLAALGVAVMEEDGAARVSMLESIRQRQPEGIAGLLAVMEIRRTAGEVKPTRDGQGLRDYLLRWPSRVWYTDLTWSPWISMRLEIAPARVSYLSPIQGVASFRNLAGVPVSVGPESTVPTRMLVSITPSKLGQPMTPLPPMVIDIGRTLTIPEGGSLRVPFRLDHSALGSLLALNPTEPIDFQATAVLDPRPTGMGGVRPGPVGAMDTNRASQDYAEPATAENVGAWLESLGGADSMKRLAAVARLLDALESPTLDESLRNRIGDAIGERFAQLDPVGQAWVLRFLPAPEQRPAGLRRVVDLALRSREPLVRVTQLAAQVRSPNDTELAAGLRDENPVISGFAQALRTTLREGDAAQP